MSDTKLNSIVGCFHHFDIAVLVLVVLCVCVVYSGGGFFGGYLP